MKPGLKNYIPVLFFFFFFSKEKEKSEPTVTNQLSELSELVNLE